MNKDSDDAVFVTRESLVHVDHKEYDEINILYAEMKQNHRYDVRWEGKLVQIIYDGTIMIINEALEDLIQLNGEYPICHNGEIPVIVTLRNDHIKLNIDKMEIDYPCRIWVNYRRWVVTRKDSRWITIRKERVW